DPCPRLSTQRTDIHDSPSGEERGRACLVGLERRRERSVAIAVRSRIRGEGPKRRSSELGDLACPGAGQISGSLMPRPSTYLIAYDVSKCKVSSSLRVSKRVSSLEPAAKDSNCRHGRGTTRPCGGRTWWAHFEFTRLNIDVTTTPTSHRSA